MEDIEKIIRWFTLRNAVEHNGKALTGSVMGALMAAYPDWRSRAREIKEIVQRMVEEINRLGIEAQRKELEEKYKGWKVEKKERKERKGLPELPGAEKGKVVMRFAPNPDFVMTLGNARPAILNHAYVKMYGGKFILRYDDTDVKIKTPIPEVYEKIKEDLEWLGIVPDEIYYQSKRLPIYYKFAKKLIELGHAYVCTCSREEFKKYKSENKPCPHRNNSIEENLELWEKMLDREFGEEEAVLRIKTGVDLKDTSLREWVAFRIVDTSKRPHPVVGDKYTVWPTYNFASAIDDHELGITHILRAKEHIQNTRKQEFIYRYLGWKYPVSIHFGRISFSGITLSKSKIRHTLESAPDRYLGYDDPRFGTVAALRRRGFAPEAIREVILQGGIRGVNSRITFENLAAINKKYVDPVARRVMFVGDPVLVKIENLSSITVELPVNPSNEKMGIRKITLSRPEVYVEKEDARVLEKKGVIRLFQLANIHFVKKENDIILSRIVEGSAEDAVAQGIPIVQWVPVENAKEMELLIPEGDELITRKGKVEGYVDSVKHGEVVQLLRTCFARIEKDDSLRAFYTHK